MKKQITEIEFIGGQGTLTKEEELALARYFSEKKAKSLKSEETKQRKKKKVTS